MSVFKETKYDCLSRDLLHLSLKRPTMTVFKDNAVTVAEAAKEAVDRPDDRVQLTSSSVRRPCGDLGATTETTSAAGGRLGAAPSEFRSNRTKYSTIQTYTNNTIQKITTQYRPVVTPNRDYA